MEVVLSLEHRFRKGPNGKHYSSSNSVNTKLWERYLEIFDNLIIVARVKQVSQNLERDYLVEYPNVSFCEIPYYVGPFEFLKKYFRIKRVLKKIVKKNRVYICRVPSIIGNILARQLTKNNISYGVEVVGDPAEVFASKAVSTKLNYFHKARSTNSLKKTVADASAVLYVTKNKLQEMYPSSENAFQAFASNVLIEEGFFANHSKVFKKNLENDTIELVAVGSLSQLYKSPDVVVKSIEVLHKKGVDASLKWLGGGACKRSMIEYSINLGLEDKIKFLGNVPFETVEYELSNADMYIHVSRTEGLPRSLIEAMAKGLPCIGSKKGGIPELLESVALIDEIKPEVLASKIYEFLRSKYLMNEQAQRNLRVSKGYKNEILKNRRNKFYKHMHEEKLSKKVLIVPSNTDLNRGDQALTWASIDVAKDVFSNVEIRLYKSGNKVSEGANTNRQTSQRGFLFLTRLLLHPARNSKINKINYSKVFQLKLSFIAIKDFIISLFILSKITFLNNFAYLFLTAAQKKTVDYFENLDVVFVKGGGFLHSYGKLIDAYIMYFQLFDVFLAQRYGKRIFVLPNSVGPLENKFARKIVEKALAKCTLVTVREGISYQYLKELNVKARLSPDLGFYLKPSKHDFKSYLLENGIDFGAPKNIAITMRPYRFDGHKEAKKLYTQYINEIKKLIRLYIDKEYDITLLAHAIGPSAHEDDRIPLKKVYQTYKEIKNVHYLHDASLNCRDIEKIYSYFDLVIGTRFHSVIFSINVNTPAIAISYGGNKANGIMNDMGLSDFVVPIENPKAAVIIKLTDKIFYNENEYLEKIYKYKEIIMNNRLDIINSIKSNL